MVYKTTKRVSVPNLKSFRRMKTELLAKEAGEFSIMLYGKMGCRLGAFSCPPTWLPRYKCMEVFKTLNSHNFCIFWCIYLKLAEIFQNEVIYIVLKLYPRNRLFKFLMSLQTMNIGFTQIGLSSKLTMSLYYD